MVPDASSACQARRVVQDTLIMSSFCKLVTRYKADQIFGFRSHILSAPAE